MEYNESDFVEYALKETGIAILSRNDKYFDLPNGFQIEVEGRDLYRLSHEGWVISPFDDIGRLCTFLQSNINHTTETNESNG
ncbi:hypothetical protein [Flectobacillus major]|jgi:hypothetical protein|uniref:hypothetical protein n=1 Tax=Flectobacillus major TaxID=103 RepID=UPI000419CA14|nr:hypothetical protein [Flectobacillus major]